MTLCLPAMPADDVVSMSNLLANIVYVSSLTLMAGVVLSVFELKPKKYEPNQTSITFNQKFVPLVICLIFFQLYVDGRLNKK